MALPATVLAAIVERPFLIRAGVSHYPLWYSLQANFASLLLGLLTLPLALGFIQSVPFLWSPIAVSLSIAVEGWYLCRRAVPVSSTFRWGPVIWANVARSGLLLALAVFIVLPLYDRRDLASFLEPYEHTLLVGSSVLCLTLLIASFCVTVLRGQPSPPPGSERSAAPPA